MRALTLILAVLLVIGPPPKRSGATPPRLEGLALVNEDGSLSIGGTQVRLVGILIPRLGTLCIEDFRGTSCSDFNVRRRLERKISGFVHCDLYGRGPDGVAQGICTVEGRNRFRPRRSSPTTPCTVRSTRSAISSIDRPSMSLAVTASRSASGNRSRAAARASSRSRLRTADDGLSPCCGSTASQRAEDWLTAASRWTSRSGSRAWAVSRLIRSMAAVRRISIARQP